MSDTVDSILPPDALEGACVAVSVSESPDLARLGLIESHLRLALGEITRSVLVLGGKLAYGGRLDSTGYTTFLASELRRYGRRDRPLVVCLSWSVHRRVPLSQLERWRRDLGLYGELVCLDPTGKPITPSDGRDEEPLVDLDETLVASSLTSLRVYMSEITQGRILIGGKRDGFQGVMPGLLEEALITIEAQQPLYLAGGFGGVTLDIIKTINPEHAKWIPASDDVTNLDHRYTAGLERLGSLAQNGCWDATLNGLSDEENRRLAATHRPSEITALVSLGLGRLTKRGSL